MIIGYLDPWGKRLGHGTDEASEAQEDPTQAACPAAPAQS